MMSTVSKHNENSQLKQIGESVMRAVVQRVSSAQVAVNGEVTGRIQRGLLVYLGVEKTDTPEDVPYMVEKITNLRIFEDEAGKMNRSMVDETGDLLCISQFTLLGDCRRGGAPALRTPKSRTRRMPCTGSLFNCAGRRGSPLKQAFFRPIWKWHPLTTDPSPC
jgi:D-tyrosyl-tRNA(Tyr) deacylase